MTSTITKQMQDLEAAYRTSDILARNIHKHFCLCGSFGSFRFEKGGPWFCAAHVERGEDGLLRAVTREQAA